MYFLGGAQLVLPDSGLRIERDLLPAPSVNEEAADDGDEESGGKQNDLVLLVLVIFLHQQVIGFLFLYFIPDQGKLVL